MMIAERIRKQVSEPAIPSGRHLVRVSVSVSVSGASGIGVESTTLIRAADKALYASKDAGRNKSTLADFHLRLASSCAM